MMRVTQKISVLLLTLLGFLPLAAEDSEDVSEESRNRARRRCGRLSMAASRH